MAFKEVFSKFKNAVKAIYDNECDNCGTGFFISNEGCFITCAHVLEDNERYHILINDEEVEIKIRKKYDKEDVALCYADVSNYSYDAIFYKDPLADVSQGERVCAIVHSGKDEPSLIEAQIRYPNDEGFIVLNTELNDGDSGSPIFDEFNNLIGMHSGILWERFKKNWSIEIPSSLIWKLYFDFIFPLNDKIESKTKKNFYGSIGYALETRKEYEKSLYYYWLGVENKETSAIVALAYHYEDGIVVEKNYDKAFLLFKKADSDPIARYKIGEYYRYGYSVEKDIDEAIKLYEKNIEVVADDGLSKRALAELYSDYGTHYNLGRSYKLYQELINQNVDLKDDLNYLFVKAKYERKNLIDKYIYLHERGFKKASFELAMKFYNGFPDFFSDKKRGVLLLNGLSNEGYEPANAELFKIYFRKRKYEKAFSYFEKIKDRDLMKTIPSRTYFKLGKHYIYKDFDKAKLFFDLCDGFEKQKNACLFVYYESNLNYIKAMEYSSMNTFYYMFEFLKTYPELYLKSLKTSAIGSILFYLTISVLSATFEGFNLQGFNYLPKGWNDFFMTFFSKESLFEFFLFFVSLYIVSFICIMFERGKNRKKMLKAFDKIMEDLYKHDESNTTKEK